MTEKRIAVAAVIVAALAGGNAAQGASTLMSYWWTDSLPDSTLFAVVLYAVWLPIAVLAISAALFGSYSAIRGHECARRLMIVFAWAFTVYMSVDGFEIGWAAFRLGVFLGGPRLAIGVNALGVVLLLFIYGVRFPPASEMAYSEGASDAAHC